MEHETRKLIETHIEEANEIRKKNAENFECLNRKIDTLNRNTDGVKELLDSMKAAGTLKKIIINTAIIVSSIGAIVLFGKQIILAIVSLATNR